MTALRTCPHCFAPVRSDGRPACLCAAADAADFDPLRIRPYVSLPDEDEAPEEAEDSREHQNWAGDASTGRGERLDDLPGCRRGSPYLSGRKQDRAAAPDGATVSPDSRRPSAPPTGPIVLREGSSGSEVAELQGRLRQLAFYLGAQDG